MTSFHHGSCELFEVKGTRVKVYCVGCRGRGARFKLGRQIKLYRRSCWEKVTTQPFRFKLGVSFVFSSQSCSLADARGIMLEARVAGASPWSCTLLNAIFTGLASRRNLSYSHTC